MNRRRMETEMETESESETQTETEYQTGDETENPEGVQTEEGSLSQDGQEVPETTGNSSEDNGDPNYGVDRTGQSPQSNYKETERICLHSLNDECKHKI